MLNINCFTGGNEGVCGITIQHDDKTIIGGGFTDKKNMLTYLEGFVNALDYGRIPWKIYKDGVEYYLLEDCLND